MARQCWAVHGEEWSDEIKQRALALCLQTGNISEASRRLTEELGSDPAPPIRTVNVWVHRLNPDLYQQIANNKRAIVQERWLDVELAALDATEAAIESGEMKGQEVIVAGGIAADKRIAIENLNARFKGGSRVGLLRMMERMEGAMREGKAGTRILEAVVLEGEMP